MKTTLYYSPGACSLSVHITLIEKKLDFALKKVNLATHLTEDGVELATINPKNYVPVLVLADGNVHTEVVAILSSLENTEYKTIESLSFISSELHKSFGPFFNKKTPEEYKVIAREKITNRFNYVEAVLSRSEYFNGSTYSACDAYLFTILRWLKLLKDTGLSIATWPTITTYYDKIAQRPAVQAAIEVEHISV
ncbi:MAG TPA: glutathione binding-like protein [Gammaproteobacteria bacterium]|nr:glutathione binding-like protein [Gammaproteobacteria bacterium]